VGQSQNALEKCARESHLLPHGSLCTRQTDTEGEELVKKRALGIAAAAVLSVSALSMGMGGAGGVNASSASTNGSDAIVQGIGSLWSGNFMPYLSSSAYDIDIWGQEYMSLLGETPHAQLTTYGGLVSKYTVSKNKKTFTFWLSPKARWSNGRRVTARDAQLFLQWMASKAYAVTLGGPYVGSFNDIVGMTEKNGDPLPNGQTPSGYKQLGKYEFSITISQPYANALINEVSGITPLPYFLLHKYPFQDWNKIAYNHFPDLGDGPYVVSKIIPEEVVVETANKYFEYGPPRIPTYEFKYVLNKLKPGDLIKGLINYTSIEPKYYTALKSAPGVTTNVQTGLGYQYIGWRLNNATNGKIFDNVHFRRGVLYAINRVAFNEAYNKGLFTLETGPLPDVYSWYDKAANTGKYAYPYNVKKAIQEFEEAGLVLNKKTGFFQYPNGTPFKPTFDYSSGLALLSEESTTIAQFLHAAHIDLVVNPPLDFNTILSQLANDAKGTQPVQGFSLGIGIGSDPSFYSILGSTAGFNTTSWDITDQTLPDFQPEDMKLLTEQKSAKAFNRAYRKKVLDQWQILFSKYLPYEILGDPDTVRAYSSDLKGIVISPFGAFYDWKWYFSNSN
jgi:peptide/nickel transport system substrate-binding protein